MYTRVLVSHEFVHLIADVLRGVFMGAPEEHILEALAVGYGYRNNNEISSSEPQVRLFDSAAFMDKMVLFGHLCVIPRPVVFRLATRSSTGCSVLDMLLEDKSVRTITVFNGGDIESVSCTGRRRIMSRIPLLTEKPVVSEKLVQEIAHRLMVLADCNLFTPLPVVRIMYMDNIRVTIIPPEQEDNTVIIFRKQAPENGIYAIPDGGPLRNLSAYAEMNTDYRRETNISLMIA